MIEDCALELKSWTGIGIRYCRKAAKASDGNFIKAMEFLNSTFDISFIYDIFTTEHNVWEF